MTAILAGGCFWCTEALFQRLKGVNSVVPGYTGGFVEAPSYEQVSRGDTGHVEAIKIEFDESVISFSDLLQIFFYTHDPTTYNRQGNDVGPQYNSSIFYITSEQKEIAEKMIAQFNEENTFQAPVVTSIEPAGDFFVAEDYHHNYYERNKDKPYCALVINPKLQKLVLKYSNKLNVAK